MHLSQLFVPWWRAVAQLEEAKNVAYVQFQAHGLSFPPRAAKHLSGVAELIPDLKVKGKTLASPLVGHRIGRPLCRPITHSLPQWYPVELGFVAHPKRDIY